MELYVTKKYLAVLFILWVCSVGSGIWGWPVWSTISFMCFFLIYAGHEWIHVWICRINNVHVETVSLSTGGETEIEFEKPESDNITSDIFLAGVAYDSILFTISILSSIFYGILYSESIPVTFGCSLILILIFNLAMPNSDWQHFIQTKRA